MLYHILNGNRSNENGLRIRRLISRYFLLSILCVKFAGNLYIRPIRDCSEGFLKHGAIDFFGGSGSGISTYMDILVTSLATWRKVAGKTNIPREQ